jgi:hypothetical protein
VLHLGPRPHAPRAHAVPWHIHGVMRDHAGGTTARVQVTRECGGAPVRVWQTGRCRLLQWHGVLCLHKPPNPRAQRRRDAGSEALHAYCHRGWPEVGAGGNKNKWLLWHQARHKTRLYTPLHTGHHHCSTAEHSRLLKEHHGQHSNNAAQRASWTSYMHTGQASTCRSRPDAAPSHTQRPMQLWAVADLAAVHRLPRSHNRQ